ncbi:hypothetical protein CK203_031480 [Vitis vinifera]|uniref:DUF4408 domain-containing protein n=1 Tax=Vitis vinifera TaxID=29760 RepID=A0A438I8Q5_VITVI|nr:hypothetical protein CK203_031480 [Vitis vinifera]
MAILSTDSTNWGLSLKVLLISTGVVSMAVALKISVPVVVEFAVSEVPSIWSFVLSWLRPPYLYLVINFIIIIIVASSKLQHKVEEPPETAEITISSAVAMDYAVPYNGVVSKNVVELRSEFGYVYDANAVVEARAPDAKTEMKGLEMNDSDEFTISRSSWTPERKDSMENMIPAEKPLVSMRFGHRRAVKSSPEGVPDHLYPVVSTNETKESDISGIGQAGKVLGVSKPKRHDTLESTWKTITDGRPMPLTRHLKKADSLESQRCSIDLTPQKVKKSETFTDRSSTNSSVASSPGSGKMKREPSLSQDELNRRVEAFIKKFNEEMRLQRQESLNQYNEMIRRGARLFIPAAETIFLEPCQIYRICHNCGSFWKVVSPSNTSFIFGVPLTP